MPKSIDQLVDEAFDEKNADDAQKFMDITFESWKQASETITRTVVFTFLLGAIFELLVSARAVSSLSLGGLSFSNTSLLQQFIPALMAYLFYDTLSMVGTFLDRRDIYEQLVKKFKPTLAKSELLLVIQPRLRGPWGFGREHRSEPTSADKFDFNVSMIVSVIATFFLPIAFEIQAYYSLVNKVRLEKCIPMDQRSNCDVFYDCVYNQSNLCDRCFISAG